MEQLRRRADVVRTEAERRRQEALGSGRGNKQRLSRLWPTRPLHATLSSREAELAQARAGLAVRRSDLAQAKAGLLGRNADLEAQRRQRAVLDSQEGQLRADLNAKQAGLKVTETNLEYTRILAPTDGIVGERKVRVGQLVSPGTQVLSLVQSDPWVLANYRRHNSPMFAKAIRSRSPWMPCRVWLSKAMSRRSPGQWFTIRVLPPDNATEISPRSSSAFRSRSSRA